jgi:hypothetical protein
MLLAISGRKCRTGIGIIPFLLLCFAKIGTTYGQELTNAQSWLAPQSNTNQSETENDSFIPPLTPIESIFEVFAKHPEHCFMTKGGASAHERPMWSPINVTMIDPMKYPHIDSLDNGDPESLFYTYRPNLFNMPVEDEWDWFNLINTDRSDFTDTPFSVSSGNVVMETGTTNTRVNTSEGHATLRTLPESLFRVGISNEFELRLKWLGYQMLSQTDPNTGSSATAFGGSDLDLGFKYVLFQQKDWFPMTTVVGGALLPTGTNGFTGNQVQPHFNIVNGWSVRRWIFLKHQFGLDYLTQPTFSVNGPTGTSAAFLVPNRPAIDSYHSSVSCLYQATKRIGGFVEWFVLYGPNQYPTNFTDSGIFFYFTPTIQFDAVIGSSIAAADNNTIFTKFGFSTRW